MSGWFPRHRTHSVIHETLVDLRMIGPFRRDGRDLCRDRLGPRAMRWHEKDVILASADQVAIDAISAHLQGFDPSPYRSFASPIRWGWAWATRIR